MSAENDRSEKMEDLVRAVSFVSMPLVLLMVLAPRARITRALANNNLLVGTLAATLTGLAVSSTVDDPDVVRALASLDFAGIRRYFGSPLGAATTWTHMTTNDFFIARWIYLDSLERGRHAHLFTRLAVMLQFFSGPVGLLSYLLFGRRSRKS